jgi:homoserine kinase
VLFIPDDEMSTKEARQVLPKALPYKDAVFNISRAAMLVNCFATAQCAPSHAVARRRAPSRAVARRRWAWRPSKAV